MQRDQDVLATVVNCQGISPEFGSRPNSDPNTPIIHLGSNISHLKGGVGELESVKKPGVCP